MAKSVRRQRKTSPPERPLPPDPAGHRLPAARAFVVQLPDGDLGDQPLSGRVEHVLTGRSTRFEGLERLAEFFTEVLAADEEGGGGRHGNRESRQDPDEESE